MGARVNLWVLVFATVLILSTWYISELPDRIYTSLTEPQDIEIAVPGPEVIDTATWLSEYTTDYYDASQSGDILAYANLIDQVCIKECGDSYDESLPITYNVSDTVKEHFSSTDKSINYFRLHYATLTGNDILANELYFVKIYFQLDNIGNVESIINYRLELQPSLENFDTPHVVKTIEIPKQQAPQGVWINFTLTDDEIATIMSYASCYMCVYVWGIDKDGYLAQLASAPFNCFFTTIFYKPEAGAYETENGETVVIHSNQMWTRLNVLKVSAGLVGAMCILAAVASTPLWNPTRAWGRRRGRR